MFSNPLHELEHVLTGAAKKGERAAGGAGNYLWQGLGYTHPKGQNPGALAELLAPLVGAAQRIAGGKPPTRAQLVGIAAMFPGGKPRTGYLSKEQELALAQHMKAKDYNEMVDAANHRILHGYNQNATEALLKDLAASGSNMRLPHHGLVALGRPLPSVFNSPYSGHALRAPHDVFPTNAPYWTTHGGFPRIGQQTTPPFRGLPLRPGQQGLGMTLPSIEDATALMMRAGFLPSFWHPHVRN